MKPLLNRLGILIFIIIGACIKPAFSQVGVLDPNDPIVVYDPQKPPKEPIRGQIAKWVKTSRLSWSTTSYKSYIYKGMAFRLKFPKSYVHGVADGKTYPVLVFFHGRGEGGTIYDNEFQLYNGGQAQLNAVNSGKFDGFLIYPQNTSGFFNVNHYDYIKELIENFMVPQVKVDIDRIYINGLSGGGTSSWEFMFRYPKLTAASLPISSASLSYIEKLGPVKYIPVWHFQGGLDKAPHPNTAHQVRDAEISMGAQYRYNEYPTMGHSCWNAAWAEADFYPFLNRAHKANPWPLSGRSEFCPGDAVNVTLGVTAGFEGYEWRKNGVVISNANSNELVATSFGVYDCRILRGTVWSPWSPVPVTIRIKSATVAPSIQIAGMMSRVIPAPDGNASVTLGVPDGYTSHVWQRSGSSNSLSSTNILDVSIPGDYVVKVTEQFGCSSAFSSPFTVIDADGPNKPDAAMSLTVSSLSKTSLRLDWSDNPAPVNNETAFEIYQAQEAGGPYKLIGSTTTNIVSYTVVGLLSNTKYFFKVRAINNTAAAAVSNEASASTAADVLAPTAPINLGITGTTRNSVSIAWNASSDDVQATKYDIYINGLKSFVTTSLSFTAYNLEYAKSYNFTVKARDFAGNESPFSNQVTAQTLRSGLTYKYYILAGTYSALPDFAPLIPDQIGVVTNVTLTTRTQSDNFAFLFEGEITIATAGTYVFRTNSDAGSKLYLGALNGTTSPYSHTATPLVNNDGVHGGQNRDGTITLSPGRYPIAVTYFEQTGGESLTVTWKVPGSSSYVTIPNNLFVDPPVTNGVAPLAPSNLDATAVTYRRIDLSWTDNSNNETGFEISRSTNVVSNFVPVGTVKADATTFTDSLLSPATSYYYRVRAIGQYGESGYTQKVTEASWKLNNAFTDASGYNRTLTTNGSPAFDATNKAEGTHAVRLNGTSQYMSIPATAALMDTYTERTVSLWIKSGSNTGNRVIFDLGGNDNGLALVLNNNTLIAAIASSSNFKTIVTPYTSTTWNHVALVYKKSSFKLYVNGVESAANNTLSFSAVNTTSNASRIGLNSGSNAYNTNGTYFNGWVDNFQVFNTALTPNDITTLKNNAAPVLSNATTLSAPTAPAAPAGLEAKASNTSANQITWGDAGTEEKYELYRSVNTNANFVLLATLPMNTNSFQDADLFSNAVYYYKVMALNEGGNSAFSNEDSAKTGNNLPVISAIDNQFMRFGTQVQINVSATDADGEALTMQVFNLPAFATFTPAGSGAGVISLDPARASDQGVFNNITLSVTDQNSGNAVETFNLTVNDNYTPVIGTISNVSLGEKQTAQLNLAASDVNVNDVLRWSFTGLPPFAAVTTGKGTAQISLAPGYSDGGSYVVTARVDDGKNGSDTSSFTITVSESNPNKKIYIDFGDGSLTAPAPWNNTAKVPAMNDNFANLKDEEGAVTPIGLKIMSSWQNIGNGTNVLGATTGNNSGVYPDNVMKSAYYSNTIMQTILIYGLDMSTTYNFTFSGSRGSVSDNRTTVYTIKGASVSLNAAGNTTKTVSLDALQPDAGGTLTLTIKNGTGSSFSYLNAMVIESIYDDGSVPATPRNFTAQLAGGKVNLGWLDAAYNETGYHVYRAVSKGGQFTMLNPVTAKDVRQFQDAGISGNRTYYYAVRGINAYGGSSFTDTLAVSIPNLAPSLGTLSDINMRNDQVLDINVSASDEGDVLRLQARGLPRFATFTDNGDGTARIHLAPAGSDIGKYQGIVITASDGNGASSSDTINILVTDKDITSFYVNFNQVAPVGAPWNSFNNSAIAGRSINNLLDENGTASGATITLLDGFTGANDVGATTGNNSGIYPDDVMKTAFYESTTAARRIRITGLVTTKKYNLVFFGSRIASDNRTAVYTSGGNSVSLNAAGNTSKTVQINGLVADAGGMLEFTVARGTGSSFAYINALVIQSYADNGMPLAPAMLQAVPKSKIAIQLNWSDKSDNETGFEVYRSGTRNGAYALVTTTAANETTYMDQGLQGNTRYFYKVRAVLGALASGYSNISSASTFSFQVFVNFNRSNPAPAPWNNTNNVPQVGSVFANLNNDQGNPTGMDMTVMTDFSGENPLGMVTGDNSGLFPDNVIRSTWWLDANVTSQLKISGLSRAMAYSFVFFGSRDGGGDRTTVYTVNGKSVSLNCSYNVSQTVQIDNIRADANGEVLIDVSLGATATFGYIGALIIQASDVPADSAGSTGVDADHSVHNGSVATPESDRHAAVVAHASREVMLKAIQASPNPFSDHINVNTLVGKPQSGINVRILDLNGRIVYSKDFSNVPQGNWNQRLDVGGSITRAGVYFLQLTGRGTTVPATVKLIKVK